MTRSLVLTLSVIGLVAAGGGATSRAQQAREPNEHGAQHEENTFVKIPIAMALEHEAIHERLAAAIAAGGRTGAAARNVEAQLAPHFAEENRFALPPLGVLPQLAREGSSEQMRPAIAMARYVEENLDRFIEEHRGITRALDELEAAAKAEGNSEALHFAEALREHAQAEEVLFYPMTILIGRYLQRELDGQ
jgi:hypothetical protein